MRANVRRHPECVHRDTDHAFVSLSPSNTLAFAQPLFPVTRRHPTSPERFFTVNGRLWRVFEAEVAGLVSSSLVFSQGGQLRFLARYPEAWYEYPDERLTDLFWDAEF